MYGMFDTRKWFILAFVLLFVVSFVFVFHSIIPHEHPHDVLPLGPFGILHNGLAEKFLLVLIVALVVIAALSERKQASPELRRVIKLRGQSFAVPAFQSYRSPFSKGIIHLNQC